MEEKYRIIRNKEFNKNGKAPKGVEECNFFCVFWSFFYWRWRKILKANNMSFEDLVRKYKQEILNNKKAIRDIEEKIEQRHVTRVKEIVSKQR